MTIKQASRASDITKRIREINEVIAELKRNITFIRRIHPKECKVSSYIYRSHYPVSKTITIFVPVENFISLIQTKHDILLAEKETLLKELESL